MDRFDSMRLLVRVVERQSFSAAASDLGVPRSSATTAIKQFEQRLGVRLLQRTTRHVTPTLEGEIYYRRCKAILAEIEDAEAALTGSEVRGLLRIDVHGPMARTFILPELPAFLGRHPALTLYLGEGDRFVDIVREGYDCVIRAGEIADSDMIVRRLGLAQEATFASPAYIERHGMPRSLDDLKGHEMIGFASSRTGQVLPLEFTVAGEVRTMTLPVRITVTNSESYAELARLGFGLMQAPRYRYSKDLAAGRLVEVLPEHPPTPLPISVLYPRSRQLSPRVRVFIDWLVEIVAPEL
ncbi:LysR family transcriptional regulator [Mesorhizobium sp. AR10]|uniref:LysR family transcriptional regulator n=1 Tax=Mesorhizobium sp. AR10 TaxID=2865839 RepID=UPI00215F767F|nr:LysR family transcriptional regulator [Mesorhizobium sp. AR10]UVK37971.1 LysR family transcriptional regulator [Mesorhizobium sp. AR10]